MNSQSPWGRVDSDGTVYVKTREGERAVGQWPDADPDEAMALFTRRYDGLRVEVELLDKRVRGGSLSPEQAETTVKTVRETVATAAAVGDLDGLLDRLDALGPVIAEQRETRKAAKAERTAQARATKERIVEQAEQIAAGTDWRGGADKLRALLDEWKAQPRLDKATDDPLWHRFSSARTAFTRKRKQQFAELNEKRQAAKHVKQRLLEEAERLANSTDWGPTSRAFRDLMQQWKAAGPAPRADEERLWTAFRAAQDTFFNARDAANAELDREFAANAEKKRAILDEAEQLLPVEDAAAARSAFRPLSERWDAAGKVPRGEIRELEGRMRAVENAIRDAEDAHWQRSNPEARARAADTVAQLESSLADLRSQLDKAKSAGNDKKAREAEQAIEAREAWLVEARKALADFS
jgi:Domain of Unknown Function (DUF349)